MKIIYIAIGITLLAGIVFYLISCRSNTQSNVRVNQKNENTTKAEQNNSMNNPYEDMRAMALAITPEQLGLNLTNEKAKVYGVVMDWNTGQGIATFTAFQTGDASMYTSTGGGVIGGGYQENVKRATVAFVYKSQNYLNKATKTETTPLPEESSVKFYFLTNKGKFVGQEKMDKFDNNSSQWLELFEEANKVITELRLTTERDEK